MLKNYFNNSFVSLQDCFLRTASPLNSQKGRRNHRSDQSSLYLGVQPVYSDSTEPSMLHRFSRKKQSLLKIKRSTKNDSIEMEGRLNTKEPNPMIVIGFENNRDGYSNIKQQIESLKIAFNLSS